jgi:hypothetical protein
MSDDKIEIKTRMDLINEIGWKDEGLITNHDDKWISLADHRRVLEEIKSHVDYFMVNQDKKPMSAGSRIIILSNLLERELHKVRTGGENESE